jgi:hypothetical protein
MELVGVAVTVDFYSGGIYFKSQGISYPDVVFHRFLSPSRQMPEPYLD